MLLEPRNGFLEGTIDCLPFLPVLIQEPVAEHSLSLIIPAPVNGHPHVDQDRASVHFDLPSL